MVTVAGFLGRALGQGRGAGGGAWVRGRGNLSAHNTKREQSSTGEEGVGS